MTASLDNPIWFSLRGPHAALAETRGAARRYPTDVSFFAAVDPEEANPWSDLVALADPGGMVCLVGASVPDDPRLRIVFHEAAPQFVCDVDPAADTPAGLVELGPGDWDDMAALVARTNPGPYLPRTPLLGDYIGVRRGGRLVAMAGERMHPEGATEISAVCTHPDARRSGLAASLTAEMVRRIRSRGELPFLHTVPDNVAAQRVYRALGFVERRTVDIVVVQVDPSRGQRA